MNVKAIRTALLGAAAGLLLCSAGATAAAPAPSCDPFIDFHRGDFDKTSATIDNRFMPLRPGTQYVYEGRSNVDGTPVPHRVLFTVTDLVKKINGVRNRVLYDIDESDGEITEAELAFFAQDEAGNVWNFGEYPELYEGGVFAGAPSTWIAGKEDALAGIHMLADPRVGTAYLQGYAPDVDFLDCAEIIDDEFAACSPAWCTNKGLVIDETSPLDENGGIQRKTYAPGVGIITIAAIDDPEGETLVLTEVRALRKNRMRIIRERALREERRAYDVSDVYASTPRAKKRS
jgi:hypothetical protein